MSWLHYIGDAVRNSMAQIPLPIVRALFVLALASLLVWILLLPAEQTRPPDRPARRGENLRFWAALAIGVQLLIYLFL